MYATYRRSCPVCGGDVEDLELSAGLPCKRCLQRAVEATGGKIKDEVESRLKEEALWKGGTLPEMSLALKSAIYEIGKGSPLAEFLKRKEELKKVEEVFHEATGSALWSAQRAWAIRVLRGESFSITAPTGMGKSTFGALLAVYMAKRSGKKSYIIVPTTPLVSMMAERASKFAQLLGVKVVYVHSKLTPAVKRDMEEAIKKGEFDVLVTTSRYLINKLEELRKFDYGFIFVDDVDSVLKSPKNVDRILMLLGLSEEDIKELIEIDKEMSSIMKKLVNIEANNGNKEKMMKRYELLVRMKELERRLESLRKKVNGVLVVSSATGRARGGRVSLFTRLLGFTPGGAGEGLRNVVDSYTYNNDYVSIVKRLGKGGLVFVPTDEGLEGAERVAEELRRAGLRAEVVSSSTSKAIEDFAEGKLDVLVGVATYYGVLVRGIDLPHVIRYALFTAVPRFKFRLKLEEPSPSSIYRLLALAARVYEDLAPLLAKIKRWMQRLSPQQLKEIEEKLKEGKADTPAEKDFLEAYEKIRELAEKDEFIEKLKETGEVEIRKEEGGLYVLIPDAATYLQASGRTSRLYAGGITKGLSVVIVDSEPLFRGLKRKLRWVVDEWCEFEKLDLDELLKEIDEDRKKVLKVMRGELKADEIRNMLKTVLLIVESPNKARTITSFFGKPSVRQVEGVRVYEVSLGDKFLYVAASGGHVYDLVSDNECVEAEDCLFYGIRVKRSGPAEHVLSSIKKCEVCGHQFSDELPSCPRCGSPFFRDAKRVIEGLRKLAEEADLVLVGTDPDTEGEKIGWDVKNLIRPFSNEIRRAEFHEVTKKAILKALDEPREFDRGYVWSQIIRRTEDRLTGFTLSPKLWFDLWPQLCEMAEGLKKRLPNCPVTRNLSAGRVQTPVLGWVIERYEEYKKSRKKFLIVEAEGIREEFPEDTWATGIKPNDVLLKGKIRIKKIEEEEAVLKPLPPFTTDTMLEEANSKLRLDASTAMRLAQDLFEMGFITYHRTDSTRVSDAGIAVAKEWIAERFGEEAFVPRRWGEGGAHEAIRPTKPVEAEELRRLIEEGMIAPPKALTRRHLALYDLIFRRFMASQMKEAKVKKAKYEISLVVDGAAVATKEVERVTEVLEDGFLAVYQTVAAEPLPEGEFRVKDVRGVVRHTVPLYTQADLIKLMKERGLGRPSTYAKIVSTLIERKYVTVSKVGKKLIPTSRGFAVYSYLTGEVKGSGWVARAMEVVLHKSEKKAKYFSKFVSEDATRELEKIMDEVAEKKDKELFLKTVSKVVRETSLIPLLGDKSPFRASGAAP